MSEIPKDNNLSTADIKSPLDIVAKEVKQDDRLCKQTYYAFLSMYRTNPMNLAINAPPGEGKTYVVKKVAEPFPQSDILFLSGMSDKALFHRPGILVIKDENGKYQLIQDKVAEIDSEIEDKQSEIATASDSSLRKVLKIQVKSLEEKKKELTKDAMKLIDLNHKTEMDLEKLGIKDISIDRKEQGKILAQTNSFVRRISEKSYVVISQSGNGTYEVNATECGWSCSCPDSTYRGVKCKHIHAVELATDVKKEYISS